MGVKTKFALKLGAAVLVGAAVFIGSTYSTKNSESNRESQDNNNKATDGLRDVQGVMMKTSQFITTMITVFDSVNRLFAIDPVPRYSSSTIIL